MLSHQCLDEPAWLTKRRELGVGASEAAVILGLSRFKSPYQLWHEKLGLQLPTDEETEQREWGKALEGPIAEKYARVTKREVFRPQPYLILQDEERPWMCATLDRIQSCPERPTENPVPLEIKTAHWLLKGHWQEEPPLEYLVQVQHQLAVTGAPFGSIAALVGGSEFMWCDIERDEEFIGQLAEMTRLFWESLKTGIPPAVDGTMATRQTLKALYGREAGSTVVALGGDAIEWDQSLQAVKRELEETTTRLETEKRRLENLLIACIGDAPAATLPNGVVYTYKTVNRAEYVVHACSYRSLRRKGGTQP